SPRPRESGGTHRGGVPACNPDHLPPGDEGRSRCGGGGGGKQTVKNINRKNRNEALAAKNHGLADLACWTCLDREHSDTRFDQSGQTNQG
ncbi:hypothetical protein MJO28_006648, partial [Puccinia striiformis f. sp. tritici]